MTTKKQTKRPSLTRSRGHRTHPDMYVTYATQSVRQRCGRDIQLIKQETTRPKPTAAKKRRPATRPTRANKPAVSKDTAATKTKKNSLSKLLSPDNIQESVKTVGSLRKMVKNWMQYLQQADQMLDTVFVTSNTLKESGVLDKLIKQRGKNLTTEDFTNVLMALMSSPIGGQLFKGSGNAEEVSSTEATPSSKP